MAKTKKTPKNTKGSAKKSKAVASETVTSPVQNTADTTGSRQSYAVPVLAAIALLVLGAVLYRWIVIARVNNRIINRVAYYRELHKQAGKQVLDEMITRSLMVQALEEKKITVTDEEIDKEISNLEKQLKSRNQKLDDVLKQQGITREQLRENISLNKGFEKFFASKLTVSDEEVKKYIEENENLFTEGTDEKSKIAQARQLLRTQKLSREYQSWLTTARQKAQIITPAAK